MPSSRFHDRPFVLDQVFVPDTIVSILDSGVIVSIILIHNNNMNIKKRSLDIVIRGKNTYLSLGFLWSI